MPDLVLGPLLRYADASEATVWVETDAACEVEFLGCLTPTFRVGDHHYALVHVTGLEPGKRYEYEVRLDGRKAWLEPGSPFPPSVIRTAGDGEALKLVFGSCRISAPHEAPYTLDLPEDARGLGVDTLYATAMRLRDEPTEELPNVLVLLGDQIYAHEPPFDTLEFIRSRRDTDDAPGEAVADFVEYAHLYRDAWGEPAIRWLLSTVPPAMIFDDHEVDDDWNVPAAWVEEIRYQPHWHDQIAGGHVSSTIRSPPYRSPAARPASPSRGPYSMAPESPPWRSCTGAAWHERPPKAGGSTLQRDLDLPRRGQDVPGEAFPRVFT